MNSFFALKGIFADGDGFNANVNGLNAEACIGAFGNEQLVDSAERAAHDSGLIYRVANEVARKSCNRAHALPDETVHVS